MENIKQMEDFKPTSIKDLKANMELRNREYTLHQLSVIEYLRDNPNSQKKNIENDVVLREDFKSDLEQTLEDLKGFGLIEMSVLKSRKVYNLK